MNILIIEDELPASNRLTKLITELNPLVNIVQVLDSVSAACDWFAAHHTPDLVFLDIHLADGSAFELLKSTNIDCPVIFTTAYDQYAVDAFKTTSIDYLLKPVKREDLERAFQKFRQLKSIFHADNDPLLKRTEAIKNYKKRFVIRFGEHIKTLNIEDTAYFYCEHKTTFAKTFDHKNYPVDYNLDNLEQLLDPAIFFRINRQYLVNIKAIQEMRTYSKARVIITLEPRTPEQPVVSSERSALFKQWLAGEV
jgi:DNA-binding LytR/AlgR family response regulator